jgi:WD40 repeat protein
VIVSRQYLANLKMKRTRKRIKQFKQPSLSSLVESINTTNEKIVHETVKSLSFSKISEKHYGEEGVKGVKWSPDSTCILTSVGRSIKLLEPSEKDLNEVIEVKEGENVYDYSWYPKMNSTEPATCCFASISKGSPVHLWDAYQNNCLRASYTLKTEQDEPIWGLSVKLSDSQVICGLDSAIYSKFLIS